MFSIDLIFLIPPWLLSVVILFWQVTPFHCPLIPHTQARLIWPTGTLRGGSVTTDGRIRRPGLLVENWGSPRGLPTLIIRVRLIPLALIGPQISTAQEMRLTWEVVNMKALEMWLIVNQSIMLECFVWKVGVSDSFKRLILKTFISDLILIGIR